MSYDETMHGGGAAAGFVKTVRVHFRAVRAIVGALLGKRALAIALTVVILVDAAIELLDIFYIYRRIEGPRVSEYFYLSNDASIGEYFEYLLTAFAAVMLLVIGRKCPRTNERRLLFVAAMLFAWLTLDNSLMIHESGGVLLQSLIGPGQYLGVDVQDLGELGVYALSGCAVLAGLLWTVRPPLSSLEMTAFGAICVAAGSAVFGVGADMIHSMIPHNYPILREIAGFIEDSGELWMLSFASLLAMGIVATPVSTR